MDKIRTFVLLHRIFIYHLYIFQLEEYKLIRFFKFILKRGILPKQITKKALKFTLKARLLMVLAFTQIIAISLLFSILLQESILGVLLNSIIFFCLSMYLSFVFLVFSQIFILPFELIYKRFIFFLAKSKIKQVKNIQKTQNIRTSDIIPNLKVIGITGSYGKTSMKEVLFSILSREFNVVKTEKNYNTEIGISTTILKKLDKQTDIFIAEMGEYVKGDVKKLCKIAQPDISIITGINEAHLERYKTMENAISTKFEIVEYATKNAVVALNADDDLILQNYDKYVRNNVLIFYSSSIDNAKAKRSLFFDLNIKKDEKEQMLQIRNYEFHQDGSGQSFEIYKNEWSLGVVKIPHLAQYIIGNILCAVSIAKLLGMSDTKIRLGISILKPVEHRLETKILNNNILLIDDTYNGNSHGIKEGLSILRKFKNRRKVYVTPGLVETGYLEKEIHFEIGKLIAQSADIVVLISNSVTNFILEGLFSANFSKDKIFIYPNSKFVYSKILKSLEPKDVVLMQNDWSDNYV
jgi:UDP-N-acetylmuramoyl-tripeptide--D-alanyl-D-alanine ligase